MIQSSKGIAYSLSLIDWDVFATLTFKNPIPTQRRAWRLAWRHFHQVSDSLGRPYSELLIALRSEFGETGDRFHFHYLLGSTGVSNLHSFAFQLAYDWKRLSGGAHAEVRPYNPQLAGADYIEASLGGGNVYELGKFNRSDRLELSASVRRRVLHGLRDATQNNARQGIAKNIRDAEFRTVANGGCRQSALSQA